MKNYEPAFSQDVADEYDALSVRGDEEATVEFLAELAGPGSALELAVGTGRIALPLAGRGVPVDGIDLSEAMVAELRSKPGGDRISVTIGDFADVGVPGPYRLIYVVFNTLFNLLTQDDQVRCFANVAARLTEDGVFVVEGGTPAVLHQLTNNQYVEVEGIGVHEVRLDVLRHDPARQTIEENHVVLTPQGLRFSPVMQRYAWPEEMDLMARMAGLRLKERWDGWGRQRYTGTGNVVSVYGR